MKINATSTALVLAGIAASAGIGLHLNAWRPSETGSAGPAIAPYNSADRHLSTASGCAPTVPGARPACRTASREATATHQPEAWQARYEAMRWVVESSPSLLPQEMPQP